MKTASLKSCKKTQKELEPNVWKEAKEFYRDNYGKMYHLLPNGYGEKEVDPKYNFHNNPKVVECKRVSYSGFDKKKTHWREYIDRVIIDADEGYKKADDKLRHFIDELKFEYWVIAGTDKPEKPQDSGSIVIMFQPLKATEENKDKFNNLIRCFNIHVGDPLNTGYSHKAPEWKGTNLVKEIPGSILDFEELYRGVLNFYNHTPKEVETLYKERKMCEYDKKFDVEVQKGEDEISGDRLYDYYINSHKTEEQTALIQLFRNDKEKSIRISNRKATGEVLVKEKKTYMRKLIFYIYLFVDNDYRDENIDYRVEYNEYYVNLSWDLPWDNDLDEKYKPYTEEEYLDNIKRTKFIRPIPFREKFNVSEKEEQYWYRKVMKDLRDEFLFETNIQGENVYENFILYKRKDEKIKLICEGLGFTDDEIVHILDWAKRERDKLQIAKRKKAKDKRDRIKELNKLKKDGKLNYNETEELKELVKPKSKKEKSRLNEFSNMGEEDVSFYNYKTNISGKETEKQKKRIRYFVDENNYVMTKSYVVENYFGGRDYNMSQLTKQYNIKSISQSEILKSNGKYKLSPDINLEVMITRMHKKSINIGNQLKPSKK